MRESEQSARLILAERRWLSQSDLQERSFKVTAPVNLQSPSTYSHVSLRQTAMNPLILERATEARQANKLADTEMRPTIIWK